MEFIALESPQLACMHWSDYEERYPNATELDDSSIWDTPYVIDENNQDNYPLMNHWINKLGDLNFDGFVNYKGASLFRLAYIGEYNYLADFNQDGVINYKDASLFRGYYMDG